MGGEDFAFYSHKLPACFWRLGVAQPNEPTYGLHHPQFNPDEQAIITGAIALATMAIESLRTNTHT